jgi:hypothetical protein
MSTNGVGTVISNVKSHVVYKCIFLPSHSGLPGNTLVCLSGVALSGHDPVSFFLNNYLKAIFVPKNNENIISLVVAHTTSNIKKADVINMQLCKHFPIKGQKCNAGGDYHRCSF